MVDGDGDAWLLLTADINIVEEASIEFKCEAVDDDEEEAWWSSEKT